MAPVLSIVLLIRCLSAINNQANAVPNTRIWIDSDQIGSWEYTPVRLANNPTINKAVNAKYRKLLLLILTLLIKLPII